VIAELLPSLLTKDSLLLNPKLNPNGLLRRLLTSRTHSRTSTHTHTHTHRLLTKLNEASMLVKGSQRRRQIFLLL